MSNNFVIRKNTIEIKTESMVLHRNNVSCILYNKSKDDETFHVYLWFRKPIEKHFGDSKFYEYVHVVCDDYLPFVEWFDNDEGVEMQKLVDTLEKHQHTAHKIESLFPDPSPDSEIQHINPVIKDVCSCCKEQMFSTCERPEFNNEWLCNTCNRAKIALKQIDENQLNQRLPLDDLIYSIYPKDRPVVEKETK